MPAAVDRNTTNMTEEEEQKMRTEIRERWLRMMASFSGKKVDLELFDNTYVSGKFVAMKPDGTHYLVDGLRTPIGIVDHAIIRMRDTVSITVDVTDRVRPPPPDED